LSPWWRRRQVPPKRRFLQEPHGVTSQKTQFFIVTAVKTSNLTQSYPWPPPSLILLYCLCWASPCPIFQIYEFWLFGVTYQLGSHKELTSITGPVAVVSCFKRMQQIKYRPPTNLMAETDQFPKCCFLNHAEIMGMSNDASLYSFVSVPRFNWLTYN
jgi:hypothetical protein